MESKQGYKDPIERNSLFSKFQLTTKEFAMFRETLDKILKVVTSDPDFAHYPKAYMDFVQEAVHYNVEGGKLLRASLVIASFKYYVPNPREEELFLACVLGWVAELGYATMIDDLVDGSESRRGKLCWYNLPGVGNIAALDSNVLLALSLWILEYYFGKMKCFHQLMSVYMDVFWRSINGETLDSRMRTFLAIDEYTHECHAAVVKGKTSIYTFYFPVALGSALAGKLSVDTQRVLRDLSQDIGYIYNVQDDYMDIFVDPRIMLKVGTDIQEGKCTWIIIEALKKASAEQRNILIENYGQHDPAKVSSVKDCLKNMGMPEHYSDFVKSYFQEINKKLQAMSKDIPVAVYNSLITCLLNRQR